MGRSKVELFLDRVTDAAQGAFDRVVAVQRPGGPPMTTVPTIFEPPHSAEGPIFGVAAAIADAGGRCFIVAVDFPLIRADVLVYLRSRFETSEAPAVVPMWDATPQVLCAGYSPAAGVEAQVASGDLSLAHLIAAQAADIIPEAELRARFRGEPLRSVNTPEELEELERLE